MILVKFNNKSLYLYLSGWAMFQLDELRHAWNEGHNPDERVASVWDILAGGTTIDDGETERLIEFDPAETFDVLCRVTEILSNAGELARKALGFEKGHTVTAQLLRDLATPKDILSLKPAVANAIAEGYRMEAGQATEVDVFAQEIQKKTEND